jgi:hypothetical protein
MNCSDNAARSNSSSVLSAADPCAWVPCVST